jgi:hypothetical protein
MDGIAGGHIMRAKFRRHGGTALILAALIAASAVLPTLAQETSQRDYGRARQAQPKSPNSFVFKAGVLQRDHLERWVLSDGTSLQTDDKTVWIDEALGNTAAFPTEGRSVRLMGQKGPGGLLVRYGLLRDQEEVSESLQMAPVSEPDQPAPVRPQ